MRKPGKGNIWLVVAIFVFAFACSMWAFDLSTAAAHPKHHTKIVQLQPVDSSGVYALPDGARVKGILLNGQPATYVLVKCGTEVDVWASRPGAKVEAILYK